MCSSCWARAVWNLCAVGLEEEGGASVSDSFSS